MNNLSNKKENHKNEFNEKSLSIEKPQLTGFETQMKDRSNTGDENEENRKKEKNFDNDFDKLMNSACYQGEKT